MAYLELIKRNPSLSNNLLDGVYLRLCTDKKKKLDIYYVVILHTKKEKIRRNKSIRILFMISLRFSGELDLSARLVSIKLQKQRLIGVPRKTCSENMQQMYRRSLIRRTLPHGCCPINLLHIFRTSYPKNTSGRLILKLKQMICQCELYCSSIEIFFTKNVIAMSRRISTTTIFATVLRSQLLLKLTCFEIFLLKTRT